MREGDNERTNILAFCVKRRFKIEWHLILMKTDCAFNYYIAQLIDAVDSYFD